MTLELFLPLSHAIESSKDVNEQSDGANPALSSMRIGRSRPR